MSHANQQTSVHVWLENVGIDGTVNSTASAIGEMSSRLRRVQNGFVRSYALTMTLGAAIVGVVILLGRLG
jgi:NADH-quinone oxidoreductase subunit L